MKIKQVNVYVVDTGSYQLVMAESITDEGISGIGEAAVGYGIGSAAAAVMIKELADAFVIGRDPFNITDIWNDFYYHTFWGKAGGAIFYAAVSALEMTLWDIKGKALGVPVYQLLGGKQRDEVRVYANDIFGVETPAEFAKRAEEVVCDGYDMIKIYPLNQTDPRRNINGHIKNRYLERETEERGYEIIREVRRAIGDKVELLIDVTCEATIDVMIRIGKKLEQYHPFWYEEPADPFDLEAYRDIKEKLNVPIAGGERIYTKFGHIKLIETRGVDIVQPDPGTCGGIGEVWHIGVMAEAAGMRIAPHNCGGPVLTAAAVQLSAALSNYVCQEVFPYRPDIHYAVVKNPLEKEIKNGRLKVPEREGLGVELNHQVADKFQVARCV